MGRKNNQHDKRKKREVSKSKNVSQKRREIIYESEKLLQICSNPFKTNDLWEEYLKIISILEKIRTLEELTEVTTEVSTEVSTEVTTKASTKVLTERFHAVEEFVNWLKENKAEIDGVSIHNFSDYGFGLQADKNFKENELILNIPNDIIFNVHTAAKELKDIESDALIQHMPQVALAISLLIEKNKDDSKWKPYLNILPKKYNTVLYMSVDDMNELKRTNVLEYTLKHCRNIVRQYAYFYKFFQQNENSVSSLLRNKFTYDEYRWAVSTVMTRQNIIPCEKNQQMVNSLIPMWDMCNHEEGNITTDFDEISNSCKCYAMKDFKANDQIFIYYGPRTNSEFFLHSGFIYPNNKSDNFKLRLGISESDPLRKKRIELLLKINLFAINEYLLKPEPISGILLGFLRVFNMNENELDKWLKLNEVDNLKKRDYTMDKELDNKVSNYLITRLKLLLRSYPTSLEDDIQLINTTPQSCKKLALQMRLSEKKMIHKILEVLEIIYCT